MEENSPSNAFRNIIPKFMKLFDSPISHDDRPAEIDASEKGSGDSPFLGDFHYDVHGVKLHSPTPITLDIDSPPMFVFCYTFEKNYIFHFSVIICIVIFYKLVSLSPLSLSFSVFSVRDYHSPLLAKVCSPRVLSPLVSSPTEQKLRIVQMHEGVESRNGNGIANGNGNGIENGSGIGKSTVQKYQASKLKMPSSKTQVRYERRWSVMD